MSALIPDAGLNYRFTAPSLPDTPRIAREWVALILRNAGRAELAESARLCTSEVVTNAHQHTCSPRIVVDVSFTDGGRVTVAVHDSAPGARLPCAPADTEAGRLALVEACADAWAVTEGGDGKAVWFSFGRQRRD
ncbi:ATP-binding protein [Streptomyces sp. H34-S4]|uniref:ATP-binding protein n=1 Tax=Streptomyces sp. H34-S4 TaxID=2996463 RepID=UPI0022701B2F|nr:ATP-binding protein [Streptomyces sp. H34-S4]MCY0936110.1 ATP-binding protein [Streptomyces sp. H34-S4]